MFYSTFCCFQHINGNSQKQGTDSSVNNNLRHGSSTVSQHAHEHVQGLVQDCFNSSALAMGLLQSCTKPSTILINVVEIPHLRIIV